MSTPAPRPAPTRPVDLPALSHRPTGWQRAAEVAGIIAGALLIIAGVIRW